jgi:cytochrome P450
MGDDLPEGLQMTALDPVYREDPYPRLRKLQAEAPVRRDRVFGVVTLTRYEDVRAVLTDLTLWRDPLRADPASPTRQRREQEIAENGGVRVQSILTMDDPDHGRIRGLITPVLYKRFAASRGLVEDVVRRRIDALRGVKAFDLVAAYAVPIPIEVISRVLGVDEERLDEFRAWSEAIIHALNPMRTAEQTEEMRTASAASSAYLQALMEERRIRPREDLVSDLVALQAGGAALTDEEIRINCNTLLIAGNLTTTDVIGAGVRLLIENPKELQKLLSRPTLISGAVEEILRFDPPVDSTARIASRPMVIGGCPVSQAEPLSPSLRAANRDPLVFDAPDRFDITREKSPHVSFGGGAHICLGAPLARIEAQAALLGLFQAFPNLKLGDAPPRWRTLPFFRGLQSLAVANPDA